MHVCMYACMYAWTEEEDHKIMAAQVYMHVCVYVCKALSLNMIACMHTRIHMSQEYIRYIVCAYLYIHVCVCIYIYIYIYIT